MKPIPSPILTTAISAALALGLFIPCASAQQTTTVTEQTTVVKKVTTQVPPARVTTEIDFLPASTANDINLQMLRDFGNVEQADPRVATEIARHPEVVENDGYVGKHPSLQAFLEKYPGARQEIVNSPGNFVTPVAGSKWNSHEAAGIPCN
jgi:hypothetical protein